MLTNIKNLFKIAWNCELGIIVQIILFPSIAIAILYNLIRFFILQTSDFMTFFSIWFLLATNHNGLVFIVCVYVCVYVCVFIVPVWLCVRVFNFNITQRKLNVWTLVDKYERNICRVNFFCIGKPFLVRCPFKLCNENRQ